MSTEKVARVDGEKPAPPSPPLRPPPGPHPPPAITARRVAGAACRKVHDENKSKEKGNGPFAVTSLRLAAGMGERSESYLEDPEKPGEQDGFHFAPGREAVRVLLQLDDPTGSVTKARLELFRVEGKELLWSWEVPALFLKHGECRIDWNGSTAFGKAKDRSTFPAGRVTLEHSPYLLKVSVEGRGEGKQREAWTVFRIEAAEIELELGPKEVIPLTPLAEPERSSVGRDVFARDVERDHLVYDALERLPEHEGECELPHDGPCRRSKRCEVGLPSNVFVRGTDALFDETPFLKHGILWGNTLLDGFPVRPIDRKSLGCDDPGDGPQIPIFARIKIKNSQGLPCDAPQALGNIKILWDWEDVAAEDVFGGEARHHPTAKTFLESTLDFDRENTEPKGDNCPVERGGKRGPGAPPVFPEQKGFPPLAGKIVGRSIRLDVSARKREGFPFRVVAGEKRRWAALSDVWDRGRWAGMSGVIFQPSRIAGDAYRVVAYLANEKAPGGAIKVDDADDAPLKEAPVKRSTGVFEIWRELHVNRYVKKHPSLRTIDFGVIQRYYEPANIRLVYRAGSPEIMKPDDYNATLKRVLGRQRDAWYKHAAIDPAVDQYRAGTEPVHFRSFESFKRAAKLTKGWSDAELKVWLEKVIMNGDEDDATGYYEDCWSWANEVTTKVASQYLSEPDGITVVQFQGCCNTEHKLIRKPKTNPWRCPDCEGGYHKQLNGFAPILGQTGERRCVFIECGRWGDEFATMMEEVASHEIGHQLFLSHTVDAPPRDTRSNKVHDKAWDFCLMSYNRAQPRQFCGMCLLRLRGWDVSKLSPVASENKRA